MVGREDARVRRRGATVQALETERLVLRNFCAEDWRDLHEVIVHYQASDVAQYDHEWPTGEDEIKGIVEWFAGGDSYLAVCTRDTGRLIGLLSLHPKEDVAIREFGFGYIFHPAYRGRGYATEACRAALDHAFSTLGAERFSTGTAEANAPSRRLLARLGFRETGMGTGSLRTTEEGEAIEFVALSYTLTREDWAARG
jgi:RimJ/RimL family protein N-acetyltransferase